MIQVAMKWGIKCFKRSTVERIEENSNDVSRCLFIRLVVSMGKWRGEEQNRKEGEMAQIKLGGGRNRGKKEGGGRNWLKK